MGSAQIARVCGNPDEKLPCWPDIMAKLLDLC